MTGTLFERTPPDDYLLRLAASDFGQSYKRLARSELQIGRGDIVVDLGCGPGADLADLVRAVGPDGAVIGVDHDSLHVEQARARTANLPQATVHLGDIHALDLVDSSIDRVLTDRVLQHVDDPSRVIADAHRVLRNGGRAVFAEPDWDTLAIDHPDISVSRSYTRFVCDRVVHNASIGRQLPRLASAVGFTIAGTIAITAVFRDADSADKTLGLQRVTERAVAAGYLTENAARSWLDHLATQPFFGSATLIITVATKP